MSLLLAEAVYAVDTAWGNNNNNNRSMMSSPLGGLPFVLTPTDTRTLEMLFDNR